MGKLHLLHTFVNGNHCHFRHSEAGKKTLTMSMKANHMIFLKVQ